MGLLDTCDIAVDLVGELLEVRDASLAAKRLGAQSLVVGNRC